MLDQIENISRSQINLNGGGASDTRCENKCFLFVEASFDVFGPDRKRDVGCYCFKLNT